ncbi:cysteine-rich motor neuron 1 protein-like isoform X2 [Antedon mediterranea]|uniref:cysteine-rich motor neuron 1 protein-like isoform X2 n=1 Tax=Antedon mediterranea TaxID=105859 RepID=UPI003AF4BBB2
MYYKEIYSFDFVLLAICLSLVSELTSGLQVRDCETCSPQECVQPFCKGDVVLDECDCCFVCAKVEGEKCGGVWGIYGVCEYGLDCKVEQNIGDVLPLDVDNRAGVCTGSPNPTDSVPPPALFDSSGDVPTDCTNIKCVVVDIQCPNDSVNVTVISPYSPTECCAATPTCRCDPSMCNDILCAGGYEKVLISAGDGRPGTCCDNYQCQAIDCSNVECPPSLPSLCPVNSRYVSGGTSDDGCCRLPNSCECALELCVTPTCDPDYELRLIAEGLSDPENCCPVYKCISQHVKDGCVYKEISYDHGEMWHPEICRMCECWNGVSRCMPIPGCQDSSAPPIMKALCVIGGNMYEHGDEWDHDDCTTCRCVDGKSRCNGASCAVTCKNATKVPGICCPVCDEPDVITKPPVQCPKFNCSLFCPFGFSKDDNGCPQCHCATDASKCPTDHSCSKYCIYGFQEDRWGCPRCKCKRCKEMMDCDLQCTNGFKKNDRGCNICRCSESSKKETVLVSLGSCQSSSGKHYEDSESWHDGCRECYCHSGQEMCSLITCSSPACGKPVIRAGECCPTCPDSETNNIAHINLKVCHSSNGHYYVEGETWNINMCTNCVCHDGHVLCSAANCPPLPCVHPSINDNDCCPHCPVVDGSGDGENMPCVQPGGVVYEDGFKWKKDDCTSCKCESGEVTCYSNTCPPANCKTPVLRKGQCCPSCLEESVVNCEYGGALYSEGQHWTTDSCTLCVCQKGISVCRLPECPHLQCVDTVILPGQCCPSCQQRDNHQDIPSVTKLDSPGPTRKTMDSGRPQEPFKMFTEVPTYETIPCGDTVPSSFPVFPVVLSIFVILLAVLIVIAMFLYVTKYRHRVDYQIKSKTLPTPPVTIMSIKKKNVDVKNSNRDSIRDSASFKENNVQGNMYQDTKRNLDTIDMKRFSGYYSVGKSIQPV